MKKILLFFSFIALSQWSYAQTPLTQAVDFTVTTVHGEVFNLQEKLDEGKHVIVDFFFTTCPPCIASVPTMNEAYERYGCNNGDVYFISVDNGDSDAEVLQYEEDHGGLFPSASGFEGGGNSVNSAYQIPAYPTIILIAPDGSIVSQDIFPVTTANLDAAINVAAGIAENPEACQLINSVQDELKQSGVQISSIFPNPATNHTTVSVELEKQTVLSVQITDLLGREMTRIEAGSLTAGTQNIDIPVNNLANGFYFVNLFEYNQRLDVAKLQVNR
jgi:thiol-disulfide isomerase/thioredoxin